MLNLAPYARHAGLSPFSAPATDIAALPILLSPPHLTGQERATIEASLASGWLAPAGPTPRAFEQALAEATGFAHVLGVASGTAALTLAFRLLEIGPGDEVWVPGFTFIASIAPAVQLGPGRAFWISALQVGRSTPRYCGQNWLKQRGRHGCPRP